MALESLYSDAALPHPRCLHGMTRCERADNTGVSPDLAWHAWHMAGFVVKGHAGVRQVFPACFHVHLATAAFGGPCLLLASRQAASQIITV
jgi:hypothetical protein